MESEIFIALGSNIGDRELNLLRAVAELAKLPGSKVTALSSFYDTEPIGMALTENFLNAALKLESSLTPYELLNELQRIEAVVFGRTRSGGVDDRRMDLDLLFFGKSMIHEPPLLVVPHPMLHLRRFVLTPLGEIASGFVHPLLGKPVGELLAGLDDSSRVTRT